MKRNIYKTYIFKEQSSSKITIPNTSCLKVNCTTNIHLHQHYAPSSRQLSVSTLSNVINIPMPRPGCFSLAALPIRPWILFLHPLSSTTTARWQSRGLSLVNTYEENQCFAGVVYMCISKELMTTARVKDIKVY